MEEKELYETKQCDCGEECTCSDNNEMEELLSQLNLIPPIQLDDEAMDQIMASESFTKGIGNVLEVCGSLTALVNCGLTVEGALDYILTTETMKHNMEMQKLNNSCGIEMAKIQSVQIEKTQV